MAATKAKQEWAVKKYQAGDLSFNEMLKHMGISQADGMLRKHWEASNEVEQNTIEELIEALKLTV